MDNILVVDDHELFSEGLRYIFSASTMAVNVTAVNSAKKAFEVISQRDDIDLVLLDLSLPDVDGFKVLEILSTEYPLLPVSILSATEDPDFVELALNAGAMGYISKSEKSRAVLNAVRFIIEGGVYVSPSLIRGGGKSSQTISSALNITTSFGLSGLNRLEIGLTPRQREITYFIAEGMANKEIARALDVTEATVKAHVSAILKALGVPSRARVVKVVNELKVKPLGKFR